MTVSITEFIAARLDEDHYRAYQAQGLLGTPAPWWTWRHLRNRFGTSITRADALHIEHHSPDRVLREVESKRAILTDHLEDHIDHDCAEHLKSVRFEHSGCYVIGQLAAVYSDHPDYNHEWSTE